MDGHVLPKPARRWSTCKLPNTQDQQYKNSEWLSTSAAKGLAQMLQRIQVHGIQTYLVLCEALIL